MYLMDTWYVAAWASEVNDRPLARKLLDRDIVLFRTANGHVAALEDRCCHRGVPLSKGKVEGNNIRCGYHGLVFSPAGDCVEVPGQSKVPPLAKVPSFVVIERWQLIWIWMGDQKKNNPDLIPNWWWVDHNDWKFIPGNGGKPIPTRCDYRLVVDNLLDLSHITYAHPDTIGSDDIAKFPARTERQFDKVRMTRLMPNVEPSSFYRMAGKFTGRVDRWQIVEVELPCNVDVFAGCAVPNAGVFQGNFNQGTAFHAVCHPTPETSTSCHFFYGHARRFRTTDLEMDKVYRTEFLKIFMEDVVILEAQQQSLGVDGSFFGMDLIGDAPSIAFRRLLQDRISGR